MILDVDDSEPKKPNGDRSAADGEDEGVGVNDGDAALVVVSPAAGRCHKPAFQFCHKFFYVCFFLSNIYVQNQVESYTPQLTSLSFLLHEQLLNCLLIVGHHQPWHGADSKASCV